MKAVDITKIALELLEHLHPMQIDGAEKIAALRSAAAILEEVRTAEHSKAALAAILAQQFQPK